MSIPWQGMAIRPVKRHAASMTAELPPFATRLRQWRRLRHLSQLSLANAAGTTSRHLSFLETGRSRPSKDMVHRLAEALVVPLRARNELLTAAGFAAGFAETPLDAPDLEPFRSAISRLLAQHEPFPAFVLDRHWNIVAANPPAAALFTDDERNVVRLMYGGAWQPLVENWEPVAWVGVQRLEDDLHRHPGDPELMALVDLASKAVRGFEQAPDVGSDLVICPHFRFGDTVVRTVSVVAQFGSARDVTLDELRVELVFPADAEAESFFRSAAASSA